MSVLHLPSTARSGVLRRKIYGVPFKIGDSKADSVKVAVLDESSWFAGVISFFAAKRALYKSSRGPSGFSFQTLPTPSSPWASTGVQEPKSPRSFLSTTIPHFLPRLVSFAMTLSHICLPSISSVLTSNRVSLPGHSSQTKPDMDAPETISLRDPDYLMVCRIIFFSIDFLSTQTSTENYPLGRSSTLWRPGLHI